MHAQLNGQLGQFDGLFPGGAGVGLEVVLDPREGHVRSAKVGSLRGGGGEGGTHKRN